MASAAYLSSTCGRLFLPGPTAPRLTMSWLQGSTPRNDFCRIFTTEGLLEPLSHALLHVANDDDDLAESAKAKIIHIFFIFVQSERKVKEVMATRAIVLREFSRLRSGRER